MKAHQLKLWGPIQRQTIQCRQCGEGIVVQERTDDGIYSEYVGEGGRCFQCSTKKKRSGDRAT